MAHFFPTQPILRFQGIDVSKATFDVAWWGDQLPQRMANRSYPRSPNGVLAWLAEIPAAESASMGVVMESTGGYCKELAGWILAACPSLHVSIANPFMVKAYGRSLGNRNKTDRVDARVLAQFGQERQPGTWVPLSPNQEALRDLTRTRTKLKSTRTAYRNRLKGHVTTSPVAKQVQEELIASLEGQIKSLEKGITALCDQDSNLKRDLGLLMSIDGIGLITAAVVLGAVGDLRAFRRRGELCAFLGVSPRQFQSGTSVHGKTHMCRIGSRHVRAALYMAAVAACRLKGPLGDYYRRLVAAGKPRKSALGALMRKLLVVMRAVLIQGTPYQALTQTASV
jgi:transposase